MRIASSTLAATVLGAASLMANPSALAAVVYSEAVSGDFTASPSSPTAVGTLAVGTNTVIGSLANPDSADSFSFVVSAGARRSRTSISISMIRLTPMAAPSPFTG